MSINQSIWDMEMLQTAADEFYSEMTPYQKMLMHLIAQTKIDIEHFGDIVAGRARKTVPALREAHVDFEGSMLFLSNEDGQLTKFSVAAGIELENSPRLKNKILELFSKGEAIRAEWKQNKDKVMSAAQARSDAENAHRRHRRRQRSGRPLVEAEQEASAEDLRELYPAPSM